MITRAALSLCVLLAWAVARRVPSASQRAIAAALTGLLALDVVRLWTRAGSDIDVAAFALWYAVTAGAVWSVLKNAPSPPVISDVCPFRDGGYRVDLVPAVKAKSRTGAGRLLSYRGPLIIGPLVAIASPIAYRLGVDVSRVAFAFALAAQVLAVLRFVSRGRWPDDAQRVALLLAASSLADLAGPWRVGSPAALWYVGNITSALTWLTICGWELRCLIRARQ